MVKKNLQENDKKKSSSVSLFPFFHQLFVSLLFCVTLLQIVAVFGFSCDLPKNRFCISLFLLAAAWVDPGRNALQSAEQRC